jgi:hypothetical protein
MTSRGLTGAVEAGRLSPPPPQRASPPAANRFGAISVVAGGDPDLKEHIVGGLRPTAGGHIVTVTNVRQARRRGQPGRIERDAARHARAEINDRGIKGALGRPASAPNADDVVGTREPSSHGHRSHAAHERQRRTAP